MTITRQFITIKGNRDGLQFRMDENCSFHDLVEELEQKLRISYAQLLQGPLTHVNVYFGARYLTPVQKEEIKALIHRSGNLLVKEMISDVISIQEAEQRVQSSLMKVEVGTVRSGQVLESERDILILGDVNPGGMIISDGNIFVMGALKGIAHAGKSGNPKKVIVASWLEPSQLRISDCIGLPDVDSPNHTKQMEFAYLHDGQIQIERLPYLKHIRPELKEMILSGI